MAEIVDDPRPNGARLVEPGFWGWITTGPDTVPVVAARRPRRSRAAALHDHARSTWSRSSRSSGSRSCAASAPHMQGVYSSGGSVANLVALGAARQWAFEQRGHRPCRATASAAAALAVYASAEAHHTVQRSAGSARDRPRPRAHDRDRRRAADATSTRCARAIERDVAAGVAPGRGGRDGGHDEHRRDRPVCAAGRDRATRSAPGSTSTAPTACPASSTSGSPPLYDGLELADSAIVDPHKWLGAPVGVAATFVRDRVDPAPGVHPGARGLPRGRVRRRRRRAHLAGQRWGIPYADFGVELSAPSRGVVGVEHPARARARGRAPRGSAADNDLATPPRGASSREHPRLELLTEPVLSICCFRYADAGHRRPRRVQRAPPPAAAARDAVPAELDRRRRPPSRIRPCFINSRTTPDMVDAFAVAVGGDRRPAARGLSRRPSALVGGVARAGPA